MSRASLVKTAILAAVGCAICSCAKGGCSRDESLRTILGGGADVCLGQRWDTTDQAMSNKNDEPAASMPGTSVEENGLTYSYEPGGGIDLVVWRPFGRLTRACVSPLNDSQSMVGAELVMRQAGGRWRRTSSTSRLRTWERSDGTIVTERLVTPGTVCIRK